jgi:RecB family exonuclease
MLRRRLSDDLMGFAVRDIRFAERFGATPSHFHLSFGRTPVAVKPDPSSCAEPLMLTAGPGGSTVAVSGFIDRVDVDETGTRAFVVEYEVGKPPEFSAIQRGESLHLPVSVLALERLFGMAAVGACYDSMQETGRRRFHRTEHVNIKQYAPLLPFDDPTNVKPLSREQFAEMVAAAEASVVRIATAIATGSVEATPGPHCRGCDFRDVCRTSVTDGHDGET